MKHPFDLPDSQDSETDPNVSRRRAMLAAIAGVGGLAAGASSSSAQEITTQAIGEEGGPRATTLAVGEEGGRATTKAVGEEGGRPTTKAVGEEGGPAAAAREVQAAAARVAALLTSGDLPAAYETFARAKGIAGKHGVGGLLATATTQIEAVANYEVGRGIRIINGEPGNIPAAREIIVKHR